MKQAAWLLVLAVGTATAAPPESVMDTAREYLGETVEGATFTRTDAGWYAVRVTGDGGRPAVFFITEGGRHLIAGAVIDAESGENLARRYMPREPQRDGQAVLADLAETAYLAQGKGDPVYILTDPLCGFCHKAAREIAAGDFDHEFRWVLVGWQGPAAKRQASHLLGMDDPGKATDELLDAMRAGKAVAIDEAAVSRGAEVLARHEAIAREHELRGTPVFVYEQGGEVRIRPGLGALKALRSSGRDEEAP